MRIPSIAIFVMKLQDFWYLFPATSAASWLFCKKMCLRFALIVPEAALQVIAFLFLVSVSRRTSDRAKSSPTVREWFAASRAYLFYHGRRISGAVDRTKSSFDLPRSSRVGFAASLASSFHIRFASAATIEACYGAVIYLIARASFEIIFACRTGLLDRLPFQYSTALKRARRSTKWPIARISPATYFARAGMFHKEEYSAIN